MRERGGRGRESGGERMRKRERAWGGRNREVHERVCEKERGRMRERESGEGR
jgi:hypothetical protein